jgi:hypothetical protein
MSESKKDIKTNSDVASPYDIPVEGSLGLLALGATGIREWRKVREAYKKQMREEKSDD